MVRIRMTYEGQLHCQVTHGPSGRVLDTDAPTDNRGRGLSYSPTDLVATGFASCVATIMGMRADDLGVDIKGLKIEVVKIMTQEPPRRIDALNLVIEFPQNYGPDVTRELEETAECCPVCLSLNPKIKRHVVFRYPEREVS